MPRLTQGALKPYFTKAVTKGWTPTHEQRYTLSLRLDNTDSILNDTEVSINRIFKAQYSKLHDQTSSSLSHYFDSSGAGLMPASPSHYFTGRGWDAVRLAN